MEKTLPTQSSSIGEQMGVDDLKEAIERWYLGGKYTVFVSISVA